MVITSGMGTSNLSAASPAPARQTTQEASEPMGGPDNDSDRDDRIATQSLRRTPAVNAMGESIGQLIDISA